jgi:hypothetical protein
MITLHVDAQLE